MWFKIKEIIIVSKPISSKEYRNLHIICYTCDVIIISCHATIKIEIIIRLDLLQWWKVWPRKMEDDKVSLMNKIFKSCQIYKCYILFDSYEFNRKVTHILIVWKCNSKNKNKTKDNNMLKIKKNKIIRIIIED